MNKSPFLQHITEIMNEKRSAYCCSDIKAEYFMERDLSGARDLFVSFGSFPKGTGKAGTLYQNPHATAKDGGR